MAHLQHYHAKKGNFLSILSVYLHDNGIFGDYKWVILKMASEVHVFRMIFVKTPNTGIFENVDVIHAYSTVCVPYANMHSMYCFLKQAGPNIHNNDVSG